MHYIFWLLLILSVLGLVVFFYALQRAGRHYPKPEVKEGGISLRRFPFPYRAALTICSDIDSTNTLDEFLAIQEFLTTKNETAMGKGVGLEIGNSFFPNDSEIPFAFLSENPADRKVISDLVHAGYIDCIHSFLEQEREDIQREVEALAKDGCEIKVWINHAKAASNIGSKEWCKGGKVGSEHYHTDFSVPALGCTFAWVNDCATISSVIGQGIPPRLSTFFAAIAPRHLAMSLYHNVFKEIVKFVMSFWSSKYRHREHNDLTYIMELDDGQKMFGFIRGNNSFKGIRDKSIDLADILTAATLKALKKNEGYMLVYTHLGKNDGPPFIPEKTRAALKLLEIENENHYIYVATTLRLLTYYVNRRYLEWKSKRSGDDVIIRIHCISDPVRGEFEPTVSDLQGITFYTDDPDRTLVFIGSRKVSTLERNGADHTGKKSVMIPLLPLESIDALMSRYRELGYFDAVNPGK